MKKLISFSLLLLATGLLHAQKIDSLWTAPFDYEVQELTIAPDGTPIVTTRESSPMGPATILTGINPETGAVKWKFPSQFTKMNINCSNIEFIPNTPFLKPNGSGMPLTIIDPYDGKILVDAAKAMITNITDFGFLLESGHAWVSGTTNGEESLTVFDLRNGNKLYSNTDFFKAKTKGAARMNKLASLTGSTGTGSGDIRMLCKPINHGKDAMILATTNGIFHVQVASGQIDWEAELPDPNKGKMIKAETGADFMKLMPGRGQTFFVIKPSYITAINYADGKPAWANVSKTTGPIEQIIYDQNGLILCPGSSNQSGAFVSGYVTMVDEKTGAAKWGDGIKFNGGIKNYLYTERGLAVAMVNSASNKNSINFIDVAAGKFVLPKNVNVDGWLQYLELTPKGLLYKTDREVNILGLETDKPLLSVPVQSKKDRAILSVNGKDHFYFYSDDDNSLYDINKKDGTAKVLNKAKIEFQGRELPIFMDLRADGVCLYSAQNATVITFDGAAKYSVYNPGVRTFETVMNSITAAVNVFASIETLVFSAVDVALVSTEALVVSAVTPADQAAQRNQYSQLQQAYSEVGTAGFIMSLSQFKNMKGRLEASVQSANDVYMMTKVDDRTVLLGVSKDSGAAVSKVPLAKRDKEPFYKLDHESGYLYYAPKGSNILGWSTSKNSVTGYRTP